jgi:hypothetical protein
VLRSPIFIPSGKVLQSPSLHCYASSGCLTPGLTGSKAILARALVKSRTRSCSVTPKGNAVSDP